MNGDIYRICGIDPGSNHLGISLLSISINTLEIESINMTVFSPILNKTDDTIRLNYDEITEKIISQKRQLYNWLCENKPHIVCCESPFFNRLRPSAFGPLCETLFAIKISVMEYNNFTPFKLYSPSVVKNALGISTGRPKKDEVKVNAKQLIKKRLFQIKELTSKVTVEYNVDSFDAMAVAYTHLLLIRNNSHNKLKNYSHI